jgi:hypothetical protein
LRGSDKQLKNEAEAVKASTKSPHIENREAGPGVHLLSAFSHRLGLALGQVPVPDKNNEITLAPRILEGLMLKGRVGTVDALLTQRGIAWDIVTYAAHTNRILKLIQQTPTFE